MSADNTTSQGEIQRAIEALSTWWMEQSETDVGLVAAKAVEYGSTDLAEIGRTMAQVTDLPPLTHEEATELGIYFYVLGKMARWTDAVKNNRRPSDDTLHDIRIYVMMARRNRDVGGWPFAPDEPPNGD